MEIADLSYFADNLQETIRKLKEIRAKLEISFIGRVSNGKSSIINSILGIYLLPVSSGQTTLYSIFISGNTDNIFRVKEGEGDWKNFESIDGVKNYLLEIQKENILKIEINLPVKNYKILEKCTLIDNPAIGYSDELDEYVLNQCNQSCYLYVLVIDAVASISIMEKKFLSALNKKRQISEIKILLNFTDCLKEAELPIALTHHKKSIESFFCKSDDIFIYSGYAFTENKTAKTNDNQNSNDSKKDSTTVNENLFDSGMFIKNTQVIDFLLKIRSDEEIEHFCERITYLKTNVEEPDQGIRKFSLDSKLNENIRKEKQTTIWYAGNY